MTIDQNDLKLMSVQSGGDLTSLTNQLNSTNLNIAKWTDDQTLYQGMMDKSKDDLEDRLTNVKLPFWQITYPAAVIEYGATYNVSTLSDWAIKDGPGGTPVYAYTNTLVTLWAPGGGETDPTPTGLGTYATTRVLATPSANASVMRLNLHTGAFSAVIKSVYIGQRDGATQDVLVGTNIQVTFNGGETEANINSDETITSDWITFNLVAATEYFISIYFEGRVHQFVLGNQFWQNGDFAATESWAAAGTPNSNSWFTSSIEGWDSSSGPGWDGDVLITQYINDWSIVRPLIYSKPFGTVAMLRSLNSAKTIITTRKNQIAARNPILDDFKTYNIFPMVTGPGTIAPTNPSGITVDSGKDQAFTFTGTVTNVVVDGVSLGVLAGYTFTSVSSNHSFMVYFV